MKIHAVMQAVATWGLHRALLIFRLVLMKLQIIPSSELKENAPVTMKPKNT